MSSSREDRPRQQPQLTPDARRRLATGMFADEPAIRTHLDGIPAPSETSGQEIAEMPNVAQLSGAIAAGHTIRPEL
ncbi:MAG: hypothetical protein WBP26_01820 [Candidatus Saccharimonadales bacterium]